MKLLDSLRMGGGALLAHKMRSFLTVLGIVIGIASVISLMSVGRGAQQQVVSQIQAIGTNLLFIQPGAAQQGVLRGSVGSAATLTAEDATALEELPGVALVAPEAASFSQVIAGSLNMGARVVGTTPEYLSIRNLKLSQGEFFTPSQLQARSMVAVLGANAAQTLFPETSPVDQSIRVGRQTLRVIGTLEPIGGTALGFQDNVVIVPITTAQSRLAAQRTAAGRQGVSTIYVQLEEGVAPETGKEEIAPVLRERHRIVGEDDFIITSQEDIIAALSQVLGIFTIFLGAIAGISLLVGGIGVMNIMLVSVAERTREIGIRKAVGAKSQDIWLQFLLEAVLLSLLGGGIGLAAGWGLSGLISRLSISGQSIPTAVSSDIALLALGVSVAVGVFFGVYPAVRAARLHPVEALRHQ